MSLDLNGFWLPKDIQEQLLTPETEFSDLTFTNGRPSERGIAGAVSARWPLLDKHDWDTLIELLRKNQDRVPRGATYWERMQNAIQTVAERLKDPSDPINFQARSSLPGYTGYSETMISFALNALDMISVADLPNTFRAAPTQQAIHSWELIHKLPGFLRFFPTQTWLTLISRLPGVETRQLFESPSPPDFITGYGAGNVPGTALLIALLAQCTTLVGGKSPVTIIKNSRREPLFSPLILSAIEAVDPDLVATIGVLIWDYEDSSVQDILLPKTDLTIAAASDESIMQIREGLVRAGKGQLSARFHAHGHKVSFSAIGKEILARHLIDQSSSVSLIDIVTLLAGLDSILWDQHGCLSSRVHFIEECGDNAYQASDYAHHLNANIARLAEYLPRGSWPRQQLHDRFDRYKTLETTGKVQVYSSYDDLYVVVLDRRELGPEAFFSQVNDCQGRVIVVRPVRDLMDIPDKYLRMLPSQNLQSLSVAVGKPGERMGKRFFTFAEACGRRGVTAIRTVGRGAFPQLAYSWDGYIPLDLVSNRPPGYFSTVEFDRPYEQMLETYQLLLKRAGRLLAGSNPQT